MILINLSINALIMSGAITAGFTSGYVMRTIRLRGLQKRVYELESEMLRNHAEILNLQRSVASPSKAPGAKLSSLILPLDNNAVSASRKGKTGS